MFSRFHAAEIVVKERNLVRRLVLFTKFACELPDVQTEECLREFAIDCGANPETVKVKIAD